jgi:hypothetical protein
VRSSVYGSRFRVQGLESGNVDPMRAIPYYNETATPFLKSAGGKKLLAVDLDAM